MIVIQDSFIFTECFNCGAIARQAIESFHEHHNLKLHVFGTKKDFEELGPIAHDPNTILLDFTSDEMLKILYKNGHEGTAYIFATAFLKYTDRFQNVIHFDGDIVFKQSSISLIEKPLEEGYDIVGSRRCYQNNPVGIKVDPSLPDTISTYFFGMKVSAIPQYPLEIFRKMCKGSYNPLGHDVFDFFDPVTFTAIKNGAEVRFIDPEIIGGQDANGSKETKYKSNMHLDMGSHIAHFGGVGSGYVYSKNKDLQNASYGSWALGRWGLYAKIFFDQQALCGVPTEYDLKGRWVNGDYDEAVLKTIRNDLFDIVEEEPLVENVVAEDASEIVNSEKPA